MKIARSLGRPASADGEPASRAEGDDAIPAAGGDPAPRAEHHRIETVAVPVSLRAVASVAWRVLIIGAAVYVFVKLLRVVWMPFLALSAALFLGALLQPVNNFLKERARFPRALAAVCTLLGLLCLLGLVGWFVERQFAGSIGQLKGDLTDAGHRFLQWLQHGPLHLSGSQINKYETKLTNTAKNNQSKLTSIGVQGVSSVTQIVTGSLICLFTTFFVVFDGPRMWSWVRGLFPRTARPGVDTAGHAAWGALAGYVHGTILVAAIDAICICVGLLILRVPLAIPLAVIIFLGAFVPLVGAISTGTIAVLVALVTKGWLVAVITLAILVAVELLEGHVLQPLVMGRAVRLHPVAILFAVTIGTTVAGIGGAVLAVPAMAVINATLREIYRMRRGDDPENVPEVPDSPPPEAGEVPQEPAPPDPAHAGAGEHAE